MPAKIFILARRVDKSLAKIPTRIQKRVLTALESIKENPTSGIKLHGELGSYYKFRVGDYRIVYSFNSKRSIVSIVKIEHRQGSYK